MIRTYDSNGNTIKVTTIKTADNTSASIINYSQMPIDESIFPVCALFKAIPVTTHYKKSSESAWSTISPNTNKYITANSTSELLQYQAYLELESGYDFYLRNWISNTHYNNYWELPGSSSTYPWTLNNISPAAGTEDLVINLKTAEKLYSDYPGTFFEYDSRTMHTQTVNISGAGTAYTPGTSTATIYSLPATMLVNTSDPLRTIKASISGYGLSSIVSLNCSLISTPTGYTLTFNLTAYDQNAYQITVSYYS